MIKIIKAIVASVFIVAVAVVALGKPAFMDRYNQDPYSKAELRGKCTVCHIGRGGGERNEFGEAFEDAGYRITPKLRAKFPNMFEREAR
ncbi:MAG TPA: hypothetical protein VKJ45_15530 [Blastocatellia bacterium]|nr:hypothetical protein [Blastocatellia bacterium]